jgi:hypothetical protein
MKFKIIFCVLSCVLLVCIQTACVHTPIRPVVHPISDDDPLTDAADPSGLHFWRDVRLEYFRSGELIYLEWGKMFVSDQGDGRLLIYSPDSGRMDTRAYRFESNLPDLENTEAVKHILGLALLKGWSPDRIDMGKENLVVLQAYPSSLDHGEIGGDVDPELLEFLFELFFMFLDIFIEITIS